jgi:alpha-mannosidase
MEILKELSNIGIIPVVKINDAEKAVPLAKALAKGGLAAANRGLYEYEILDDHRTLAVTLLRAVGEVGDWGVFPTPEAQCLGAFEAELALIPLTSEKDVTEGFRMAHEYQIDLMAEEIRGSEGTQPMVQFFLNWSGEGLICTCFKAAVDGNGMILRLFNAGTEPTTLSIDTKSTVLRSDIMEHRGETVSPSGIVVRPKEIITVRIEDR